MTIVQAENALTADVKILCAKQTVTAETESALMDDAQSLRVLMMVTAQAVCAKTGSVKCLRAPETRTVPTEDAWEASAKTLCA